MFVKFCSRSPRPTVVHLVSRTFASKGEFNLKGLPFSLPPKDLIEAYEEHKKSNGINFLVDDKKTTLIAAFQPFFVFDFNTLTNKNLCYHQGVAVYAGYNFRRSIANQVHAKTFTESPNIDAATDFDPKWLNRIILPDNSRIDIEPDPWNSHRNTAWRLARSMAKAELGDNAKFQLINSNRAYLPTYIFEYHIFGEAFRVSFSGVQGDNPPFAVSASDHKIFGVGSLTSSDQLHKKWVGAMRHFENRRSNPVGDAKLLTFGLRFFGNFIFRLGSFLISKLPVVVAGTIVVGAFRKIILPGYKERRSWEEDTEEKEAEKSESSDWVWHDEINIGDRDRRRAEMERKQKEERRKHERNERRREQQRQQQQQQQQRQQQQDHHNRRQQQQQQQQQRQRPPPPKKDKYTSGGVKFNFDTTDPYAVLGLKPHEKNKKTITTAFRRQMLLWHPDRFRQEVETKQKEALERSKLITRSYQILRKGL